MRTCPLNSSLFLSWLRLIWMVGEALDVGGGDSDRAASYQEQMSHYRRAQPQCLLYPPITDINDRRINVGFVP
jgi:hypothetical protein